MLARTISTVIITIVLFFCMFDSRFKWVLEILGFITVILGTIEAVNLTKRVNLQPVKGIILILATLIYLDGVYRGFEHIVPLIIISIFLPAIGQILRYKKQNAINNISASFFSAIYASLPFALFFCMMKHIITNKEHSESLSFFLVTCVFATDIGAYLVGKHFGKRKMAPEISPNKTIAGMFGGLGAAALNGMILFFAFKSLREAFLYNIVTAFILAVCLSAFCQIGDLVESAIKRDAGVKDSGETHTGHGGILDMVDGLLFCIPLFYLYVIWFYAPYFNPAN